MAKRKVKSKVVGNRMREAAREIPNRSVNEDPPSYPQNAEEASNTFETPEGEIFQRPDPVVPADNAVASDAPIYNNLPEIN